MFLHNNYALYCFGRIMIKSEFIDKILSTFSCFLYRRNNDFQLDKHCDKNYVYIYVCIFTYEYYV
jgi:hypothetical protein